MDDFRAEAVGEVNSIAVSALGDQLGQHSSPLWAGDPDTSIIGYEAEGEQSTSKSPAAAAADSSDARAMNEGVVVKDGSFPHMYSNEVEGTPNIWR
eukprot:3928541-Rhodomonas_salina.2